MVWKIVLFAGISGVTVFIGAWLARLFNHHVGDSMVKRQFAHTLEAFGAGIILSALALVLIPKGLEELPLVDLVIAFGTGALVFYYIEKTLAKKGGKMAALLAMLMDFIPESILLGALFVEDFTAACLLAVFIGLQNLPESFNAYRDMVLNGFKESIVLWMFFGLSFCGIIGALTGHFLLSDAHRLTALLMIFSSGGILYLLFQDIVPGSKLEQSFVTSLGGTLGFLVGIIAEKLI